MDAEKKTTQSENREELIKAISGLLDETIAEVEKMAKGEVSFKDLKLQPEENGDMPKEAKSSSDDFEGMKKEDEESESIEKENLEKEIPAELSEAKEKDEKEEDKEEEKDEDKKEEKEEEKAEKACKKSEEEEDPEYKKFLGYFQKAMVELGLATEESEEEPVAKSEEEAEEDLEKSEEASEEKDEELAKALEARDSEIKDLKKNVGDLTEKVEKMSRLPQGRKSVSGLKPIMKSEDDASEGGAKQEPLNKSEVLEKLLDMQKAGDKRVHPTLISKYELTGDPELVRDIFKK